MQYTFICHIWWNHYQITLITTIPTRICRPIFGNLYNCVNIMLQPWNIFKSRNRGRGWEWWMGQGLLSEHGFASSKQLSLMEVFSVYFPRLLPYPSDRIPQCPSVPPIGTPFPRLSPPDIITVASHERHRHLHCLFNSLFWLMTTET